MPEGFWRTDQVKTCRRTNHQSLVMGGKILWLLHWIQMHHQKSQKSQKSFKSLLSRLSIQTLQVHTVGKPCSSAKMMSRKSLERYLHLIDCCEQAASLRCCRSFYIYTMPGECGEPIAKINCFGHVFGQLDLKAMNKSGIPRPTWHQIYISVPAVTMPYTKRSLWSSFRVNHNKQKNSGQNAPPEHNNYDIAIQRMSSAEKTNSEGNRTWLCDQNTPWTSGSHSARVVLASSSHFYARAGHDGLFLNNHLVKGPNYINWQWNEVAYTGDVCKMFNQVMVHPDDQVYHRFLWIRDKNSPLSVYQWLKLNFGDKPAPDIASKFYQQCLKRQENFKSMCVQFSLKANSKSRLGIPTKEKQGRWNKGEDKTTIKRQSNSWTASRF